MTKIQANVFDLKSTLFVLRKTGTLCVLLVTLLTAGCGPTSSGSSEISIPKLSDDAGTDAGGAIEVKAESLPVAVSQNETSEEVEEIPVSEIPPTPAAKAEVTTETVKQIDGLIIQQADLQKAVKKANDSYQWAIAPTFVDSYKDITGQVHEHFKVSPGQSQELKEILGKMRADLVARRNSADSLQIEIKEQGVCEGKQDASTKSCNTSAPICLSLEVIKATVSLENLEQALRPLIMREFAVQHCADEALAKQVQDYYEQPAVKNFQATSKVASLFNRIRINLIYLKSASTAGPVSNADYYTQKVEGPADICSMIAQGAQQAQALQDQVLATGFVHDPKPPEAAPRVVLAQTIRDMRSFCEGAELDRKGLFQSIEKAIQYYDFLAQEFSKKSGMIILDFSKHLWPHENSNTKAN